MADFDVFLSYNNKDKPIVRQTAAELRARGITPWLDEEVLLPGDRWQDEIETIVRTCRTAAVLYGPSGIGPWQEPEMRGCLKEFVRRRLHVIPVLLPGAPTPGEKACSEALRDSWGTEANPTICSEAVRKTTPAV